LTPRSTSTKEALFSAMASAFDPSPSEAWKAFQDRRYQQGESVDGYLADLRRLLILSGLPETVSAQVRLSAAPEGSLDLTKCLLRARVLLHSPQGAMRTSRTANDKRQSRDGKGTALVRRMVLLLILLLLWLIVTTMDKFNLVVIGLFDIHPYPVFMLIYALFAVWLLWIQSPSLTAVNGSKLATTGYVTLTFHRDDER
ncbi:hypothetical protein FOL46_003260, partial [Perkinsus olseni]